MKIFSVVLGLMMVLVGFSAWADDPELVERIQTLGNPRHLSSVAVYTYPRLEKSKGIFVYSHGMTSRVLYHTRLLKAVYQAGYDVIAYDLPGHGDSEKTLGLKGGVRGFEQFDDVLKGVVALGKAEFGSDKKVVLSGWSLGGLITTVFLQYHPRVAHGAVLFAPGVAFAAEDLNLKIAFGVYGDDLVHDHLFAEVLEQDSGFFRLPPPCLFGALMVGEHLANPRDYKTPTALFTAGRDSFVSSERVEKFYREALNPNHIYLKTHHYPDSKHDLENDINSEDVLASVVKFLNGER